MELEFDIDEESLEQLIVDQAVAQLVARATARTEALVQKTVEAVVRDKVVERIGPVIDECFEVGFHRTNRYGEPQGEPMGLREFCVTASAEWLKERVDDRGYASAGASAKLPRAQWMLQKEVAKHLGDAIEKAVDDALKGIADETGKFVGQHVTKTLTRLK